MVVAIDHTMVWKLENGHIAGAEVGWDRSCMRTVRNCSEVVDHCCSGEEVAAGHRLPEMEADAADIGCCSHRRLCLACSEDHSLGRTGKEERSDDLAGLRSYSSRFECMHHSCRTAGLEYHTDG